jgi:hypothetical protein
MVVRTTITIKGKTKQIPITPDCTPSCCFVTIAEAITEAATQARETIGSLLGGA